MTLDADPDDLDRMVPLMTATGAGAASQQALGTVVFGGMIASTLLAIPFVGVFYVVMEEVGDRIRRLKGAPAPAITAGERPA